MSLINKISNLIIPVIVCYIVITALIEKKPVFDLFIEGAKEGIEVIIGIFPTLIGIFLAINMLQSSQLLDLISKAITPIVKEINMPVQIIPLAIIRPISGSAAMGVATNIMNNYGVDSYIGKVASVIMGSTETTIYTIAIYTSVVNIKKNRGILYAALLADIAGILCSVIFCRILSNGFC